jgi:glyoxylase I family protein
MFTIKGLDHVVLGTSQLDKMLAFYCDVLGCKVEKTQPDFGLTQLRAGDSIIDLVERQPSRSKTDCYKNMQHYCLRIEPFEAEKLTHYLREQGLNPSSVAERYGAQGYGLSLYIDDPDGNEVELKASSG